MKRERVARKTTANNSDVMIFKMDPREFRLEISAASQGYTPTNESIVAKSVLENMKQLFILFDTLCSPRRKET